MYTHRSLYTGTYSYMLAIYLMPESLTTVVGYACIIRAISLLIQTNINTFGHPQNSATHSLPFHVYVVKFICRCIL